MIHPSSRRGFALVIVLSIMVLLVILVVAFLSRSMTERAAASGFKASVLARQFADTAVSLVQGQINVATTQGSQVAWASQPGMVRTFNTTGNMINAYKLYSSDNMIVSSVGIAGGKSPDEAPASWGTDTAVWTDLNAPAESEGMKIYPILDPAAAGSNFADDSDNLMAKGFTIGTPPAATAYQPLPMPVRWLYVLKNGSLVAPTGSGTAATITGETKDNPVVGRVGFWTDDDTCKVNVNTASYGTYWDTPRGASSQEIAFAKYQPAQREWQRYPGHPAMTDLSAVFLQSSSGVSEEAWRDEIYKLVPRVVGGGSKGGTMIADAPLNPDADRLYASTDEMLFDPTRSVNTALKRDLIREAGFFTTARSRAPETNLFNMPRIACWPLYRFANGSPVLNRTTAFDRLIAFCSSVNGQPYFFQRENATSTTNDIQISRNLDLYSYLRALTGRAIPGFGGTFAGKYGTDRDQILTEIFDYIRSANLQDDALGANLRFTSSNGTAGLGWVAPTRYTPPGGQPTLGFGRSYTISELALGFICNAMADDPATPVDDSAGSNDPATNKVLGTSKLNAGERYIQAILTPEFFSVMQGWVQIAPLMCMKVTGLDSLKVDVGGTAYTLFPNVDNDFAPVAYSSATMITNWGGNPSYRLFGQGQGSPARGNLTADTGTLYPFIGEPIKIKTPASGSMRLIAGGKVTIKLYAGASALDDTAMIQQIELTVPNNIDMPLPKIMDKDLTGANDQKAPKSSWWNFTKNNGRLANIGQNVNVGGKFFLDGYDTVRTFLPIHGDYRLVAGQQKVADTVFVPHPLSANSAQSIAANLGSTDSGGWLPGTDTRGTYIHNVSYPASFGPDMPYLDPADSSKSAYWPDVTGDFDTGVSVAADGPYINKPDEGNIRGLATSNIPYFDAAYFSMAGGTTFFSPNRQMPSPGMFGSLPTGVQAGIPWRTLLFRPQAGHFGATSPADHLLLDLFWMPVVEPYAISDGFSTAGKINMNYQILPFTYIKRSTGMQALLSSERVAAIPKEKVDTYKPNIREAVKWLQTAEKNPSFRLTINAPETLKQFDDMFDAGNIFRSATEICDMHIVPTGSVLSDLQGGTFWKNNALTGDNLRERIYTTLYPRLTTKSNTYTVHFRAQSLKKLPSSAVGTWTEGKDVVTGEYRGSTTIERFLDSNDPNIPDYATSPTTNNTLDKFYRWRVIENRQFAP